VSIWLDVAQLATTVNVLLVGVLGGVWLRNYRQFRSKHSLGLAMFAALLFVENAFALYVYSLDPVLTVWFSTQVPDPAWQAMVVFHLVETVALAVLTWITLD
jgi:hypothetical protein